MTDNMESHLRKEIVHTCNELYQKGLLKGTSGNVSARLDDNVMLVTPSGIPYSQLKEKMIVRMGFDGSYEGTVRPTSEWRFHSGILAARPEFNAVVHTHSQAATAVSILERAIPAIHYRIAIAGGPDIPCAPYATFGTPELAEITVRAIAARRACLLAHHGVVAAHETLSKAAMVAEVVEELANYYLLCLPMGEPPILNEDDIGIVLERHKTYGQQTMNAAG